MDLLFSAFHPNLLLFKLDVIYCIWVNIVWLFPYLFYLSLPVHKSYKHIAWRFFLKNLYSENIF